MTNFFDEIILTFNCSGAFFGRQRRIRCEISNLGARFPFFGQIYSENLNVLFTGQFPVKDSIYAKNILFLKLADIIK